MKFKRKISILIALLTIILTSMAPINVCAATVGEQLTVPEPGWQRYDDTEGNILYEGSWTTQKDASGYNHYNGSNKYTNDSTGRIKFVFKGSKLRYIGRIWSETYTKPITIKIDGVEKGQFTQKGSMKSTQRINFEIIDLDYAVHTVEISSTGKYAIDAFDIDESGVLLSNYAPSNLVAIGGDSRIDLTWEAVEGANSYNIKRSETAGGPYTEIGTSTTNSFTDTTVINGSTYYYVVSAVILGTESANSNEASATPIAEIIEGNAILAITLDNGTIKEYTLTGAELNSFLAWYDVQSNGIGKAYYIFDVKGLVSPFKSVKNYIPYNKILYFDVKEYNE